MDGVRQILRSRHCIGDTPNSPSVIFDLGVAPTVVSEPDNRERRM